MRRFLHLCLERTPVIGLLMAALLFRALIPAGFMPMLSSDGTIVMELCSGFTTKSVVVHLDAHADHAGHHTGAEEPAAPSHGDLFEHSPCGFAVAATGAPPPVAPSFPDASSLASPVLETFAIGAVLPSIHRSQTPRGPPFA